MSRLIDADKLLKALNSFNDKENGNEHFLCGIETAKELVENQQTAYDADKVVEQLEEERELSYADFDRYVEEVSPSLDAEYDNTFSRGLERAVRILKGGGANDKS